MPDGTVTATLQTPNGTEEVRFELDPRFERDLNAVIHAVLCASSEPKPGRTLERHIIWPAA